MKNTLIVYKQGGKYYTLFDKEGSPLYTQELAKELLESIKQYDLKGDYKDLKVIELDF